MRTFDIYAESATQARRILKRYELTASTAIVLPPNDYGHWTLGWGYKSPQGFIMIYLPLFPKIIKILTHKYGKTIEERLSYYALKYKDKEFVQLIWPYLEDDSRRALTTGFLGGK